MTTYLDDCENPICCAKCEQPECCKRLRPFGFPKAIKAKDARLLIKLFHSDKVIAEGIIWYVPYKSSSQKNK